MGELGHEIIVKQKDEISIEAIRDLNPDAIILSPGPCTPNEAPVSIDVVQTFSGKIPILGVCLGHQTIVQAFGGVISRVGELYHGKTSLLIHDGRSMYNHVSNPLTVARYHSLVAEATSVPDCLEVTSRTTNGDIMGVRHIDYAVEGVQFHPESILTEQGKVLLANFFEYYNVTASQAHQKVMT